jgi:ATP-dependent RNA helicase DeaD
MSFAELGLTDDLLKALQDLEFVEPTPIQAEAIPKLLPVDNDFLGLAQTGTGKTGAFGLPMLQAIDPSLRKPQGIVICPTRELCMQIAGDMQQFSKHTRDVRITAVYGGASIQAQIKSLRDGSQIIVATPGRLLDLIRRRAVNLSNMICAVGRSRRNAEYGLSGGY